MISFLLFCETFIIFYLNVHIVGKNVIEIPLVWSLNFIIRIISRLDQSLSLTTHGVSRRPPGGVGPRPLCSRLTAILNPCLLWKWWSEFISLNCIGMLIIPRKEWWSDFISLNYIGTLIIPRQGWSVIFVHFSWPTHFPDTFPRSAEDVDFDIFGMAEDPEFEGCVAQSLDLEN